MVTQANWRQQVLFLLVCGLLVSLCFSRAALSIFTVIFSAFLFLQGSLRQRLRIFFQSPIFLLLSGLFILPGLSFLWSEDKKEWLQLMITKLPLLFLPLALAQGFELSLAKWKQFAVVFLLVAFAGTLYSSVLYGMNTTALHQAYQKAKLLPTPMHGDHLRFSLLVSIALLFVFYLWEKKCFQKQKLLLVVLAGWLIFFIHLLAARTGLICFYLMALAFATRWLVLRQKTKWAWLVLSIIVVLPLLAFQFLPSFSARVRYLRYDLTEAWNGHYVPGSTDGNRILSIKASWNILQQHPVGVGFGDIKNEMNNWYAANRPGILESDKLFPSSEWLVHALVAGWPGLIFLSLLIVGPFFIAVRDRFYWCLLLSFLCFSILFDTGLSTQFGVFLHCFFLLLFWCFQKKINLEKEQSVQ